MRHDLGGLGIDGRVQFLAVRRKAWWRRAKPWPAAAALLAGLVLAAFGPSASAVAAEATATVRIEGPTLVRLYGANCWTPGCWLSGLFAPIVRRENTAVVTVANSGTAPAILTPRFAPTNGLGVALDGNALLRAQSRLEIPAGETGVLTLSLPGNTLSAGLYTGALSLKTNDGKLLAVPVEVRVRSSAVGALLAAVFGIVLGRLAQLTYDPKTIARLELLDQINALELDLAGIADEAQRTRLKAQLERLRRRISDRAADPVALKPEIAALAQEIMTARFPVPLPGGSQDESMATKSAPLPQSAAPGPGGAQRFLLWLSGVSPVPLQFTYDVLMPILVLLTLVAVTCVFVLQQYGGAGADTFGAGGLADYASLFLAGIASEAIVGGLRKVRLG
ncbi:hypothetical protein ACI7BZ_14640 [Xanthobacter sp. AM11]|uniref:hypothetical protein n=1 Tax=Xanthobacter sp. AM11 TaxID=3380643 RepID=UPI0039BF8909